LIARFNQPVELALGETFRLNRSTCGPCLITGQTEIFSWRQFLFQQQRNRMDIFVSTRGARNAAILIALSLAGTIALLVVPIIIVPKQETKPALSPDAMAATQAVTAFYTLDFTESSDKWLLRVCGYTTDQGCLAMKDFFAPAIRAEVDQNRIQTYAFVTPVQLMSDKGDHRIWRLEVTLTNPWKEGQEGMQQDVYAEVANERGKWLLNRILFEQEVSQFLTPTP
jgi:hypothetical protein